MRVKRIIDRYRRTAARTHAAMGLLAIGLIAAILVLMIVSAGPSQAGFLAAEAKNLVAFAPTGDALLATTAVFAFIAALCVQWLDRGNTDD